MKVKIGSSKLVKPFYGGAPPPPADRIALSVFDKVTYDQHVAVIYAYRPPTPSNSAIELGLGKALAAYRDWAGRLTKDSSGEPVIFRNDAGAKFVEASVDGDLDETVTFRPSSDLLALHPSLDGPTELVQVQLTRFTCGSMVVGFTAHHFVADGHATSNFLVAWGQACRGIELDTYSISLFRRDKFAPRYPPKLEHEHRGVEYVSKNVKKMYPLIDNGIEDIVAHKVHYSAEFLHNLKAKASNGSEKPFTTFESLVAHLWRAVTRARGVNAPENTQIRISVDGRYRLKNPRVPSEYFGNLVLWAFAKARVEDLLREPVAYGAKILHEAIVSIDDEYFKSFIDFAHHKSKAEGLIPSAVADTEESILWPNLEVDSWLRFPFYDLDLGGGSPYVFMPSFPPTEGMVILLPSFAGDGSIDVFVPLFRENLKVFKQICYSLE